MPKLIFRIFLFLFVNKITKTTKCPAFFVGGWGARHLKWLTSPLMCVYLLCRFLVFVAALLACCADAAQVETTLLSLGWSMPSSCWWVWALLASCSCQAWRGIWRRWYWNNKFKFAVHMSYLMFRVATEAFWYVVFLMWLQIPGFCEGGTGSSIPGVEGHVNCDVLVGYKAVYRVCFGMAMFFLLFSLIMVKVKSSQDPRAAVHNGLVWPSG